MVGHAPVVERDVVPGVHMVTHGFTNCFVVEDDDGVTLVDACFPSTWTAVRECLKASGRSVADVRGLVLTHGHFDHVGFAYRLQRRHGVPVWAHRGDLPILAHPYRYVPERPRLLHPLTQPGSWPVLGAMVAGLLLGMIEILSSAYIGTTERDLFSFLILILILLYKPTGLFGTRTAEER